MSDETEDGNVEYGPVQSFYIDTDAYTDRDRKMFVCGVEFKMACGRIESGWQGTMPIHRENESRMRLLCGKHRVRYEIKQHEGYEGCETWSDLTIYQPRGRE